LKSINEEKDQESFTATTRSNPHDQNVQAHDRREAHAKNVSRSKKDMQKEIDLTKEAPQKEIEQMNTSLVLA
jgi:hypothetical protein